MSGERQSNPPRRKSVMRAKGQVAKSKEVVSTALIVALSAMLMGLSDYYFEHFSKLMLIPAEQSYLPFSQALSYVVDNVLLEFLSLFSFVNSGGINGDRISCCAVWFSYKW